MRSLANSKGIHMGFLSGKRALIVGVASDRSIAWGIAQAMHREGAELAFTYVNEKFKDRVQPLAESLGSKLTLQLDVTNDAEIDSAFAALKQAWGSLDIVVHAVAYAPREALAGGFVESTSREAFKVAHDVSSYSLTALARAAQAAHGGPRRRHPHAVLPRRREIHPELQRHGPRQGEPRSERALPRGRPGSEQHPRERHFRRAPSRRWPPPASRASARC